MDIKNLTTFIYVAELGNFSRAGEKLGYSQPTVSVQIKQLEQELGYPLFDRVGHAVFLTDKGREILHRAQHICRLCRELTQNENAPDHEVSGLVRIAMADSLREPLLSVGFETFRKHYPNISIAVTTGGTPELFSMLNHNEADFVCTLDSHFYDTNYVIANEEKIGVHFVASAQHPLANRKDISKEDLLRENFLLTERGMSYRRLLDAWMAQDNHEIQPVLEVGSADLLCRLVEQNAGVSFLPDYVTEDAVRRGAIVRLHTPEFQPDLWKQLIYHREKWVSLPMKIVIDYFSGILVSN